MNIQLIVVVGIIVAAVVYATVTMVRKRRSFSVNTGCSDDCGCNGGSKKLPS